METESHASYVSAETAKLLKQVGFDWKCREYYYYFTTAIPSYWSLCFDDNYINWQEQGDGCMSAPTLAVAQRWLREVKELQVEPYYMPAVLGNGGYRCTLRKHVNPTSVYTDKGSHFDTYEEALEAGIQECLNRIIEGRTDI